MPQTQFNSKRLIILIACFTTLIISLIWVRLLRQHKAEYQVNIQTTVQRNSNLAVALEQYTIRTLRNADAVLQLIKREYEREGDKINIPQKLKEQSINADFYKGLAVINSEGRIVASNLNKILNDTSNYSKRPPYLYHSQYPDSGMFISKPLRSKSIGKAVIIVSRCIIKADGNFGGLVAMQIEPATFTRFYADAALRPNDIISLIAMDGITYSRRTGNRDSYGEDIHKSPLFQHVAKNPVGNYMAKDAIRGIPTYFSFRKLKDFPIIATVGTSKEDALANYMADVRRDYIFATLISVLILLFSVVVVIAILHRKRILKKVKESEIKYRSIVDNTKDIILLVSPDGMIQAANPAAYKAFSMTQEAFLYTSLLNLVAFDTEEERLLILGELNVPTTEKELRFLRTDGTNFTGEMVSTFHTNTAGEKSVIIIIRDITERKRMAEQIIKEQRLFQRKLTKQVILAQEREREDIGRELHDNVNQVLTTVKLYLEMAAVNGDLSQTLVAKSSSLVMESINEIRNLSHSLSAPTLGTNSIIDSITALIDSVKPSSQFCIDFQHSSCQHDLPKEQKLALYRIIQEQLNNIVKHADASTVWITLAQNEKHTILTVKDDGRGFDTNAVRNGIGLNNIISRAKAFEGSVQIQSQEGKGSNLTIYLPFITTAGENIQTQSFTDDFTDVY